ncbi:MULTISPECIES: phosphonate ABC transporter, permease protein PhnE [unclassified Halorubrum]|uniref:phosphonate ABC transporter, permease protein PhnE n=1 Tax=unclassified Halorubrum TaxID=2642239 RepID=UPI000B98E6C3|nr:MULTISPECIES: phosphonate ABC transporter, permease protein PhnE [unclassified Halorubrum]OYR49064.1 phosphonate ABC transporter, permease protein PhnE [Halorubrum sp. Eb13]OYR49351.1 phosphonate ABC transporter, permease protein PhnE [Halorubrum sp. Ea8]OYR50793.1 phosphonate ABC transporter, permease protein PhnE [Halorubrum sp. Ea1]
MSYDESVRERYEAIVLARRVKALVMGLALVVLGAVFYYALTSVGFFAANIPTYFPNFLNALRDFFPFLAPSFPFVDPGGFLEYWTFINERNLIWGGIGGDTPLLGEAGITLAMGFAGTVMGFPFALLFGILGSGRVTPFPFNFIFRGLMSSIRAIPALVWGLIYIPLGGIGPVTATLAIATDTIGNLGRLFTDELEEIEDGPIEAMETTGANKPQTITFGMLSQVTTPFIAWTLYIFEINVRIAVSLGIIGGGGLGNVLSVQQGLFAFTNMMATILVILVLIISVEIFSQRIRSALREGDEAQGIVALLLGFPQRMAEAALK